MSRLPRPDITRDGETLRSNQFGDIYFQEADGLAETRHVFIGGNDLPERFAAHKGPAPFIIGELGFGTGLNFLAAAIAFEECAPPEARLHFWSAEGFPLAPADLSAILGAMAKRWPESAAWADRLATRYPPPRPGQIEISFGPRIKLTLAFGPAAEVLSDARFEADAWFLDGFSPSQNPDMWSEDLLGLVASRTTPGGTFATFTVAGAVRRALAASGFELARRPGHGRKREMLTGQREGASIPHSSVRDVTIIGAGIAGACAAFFAQQAGLKMRIIDPGGPAAGASGNPAGLLMPRIEAQDNAAARFYRDAFLFARQFYLDECPHALTLCGGVLQGEPDRYKSVAETALWADDDFQLEGDKLHADGAAVINPRDAVRALLGELSVIEDQVTHINPAGEHVLIHTDKRQFETDAVIIAAGPASARFIGMEQDMSASRGQVDVFAGPVPPQILTQGTYVAPIEDKLIAGATYDPAEPESDISADEQSTAANRQAAELLLGQSVGISLESRASLRATTRDRHPIAGALEGDAYIMALTGLGSRGLVTAPLLARHVISKLLGDISPMNGATEELVWAGRFAARRRRRAQP